MVVKFVLLLALPDHLCDFLGLATPALAAPAFMEVLDAPSAHILVLIGAHPVQNSAVHVLGAFCLDKVLILLLFLADVFIKLVIGLHEALPHIFDHLLVLLSVLDVHRIPAFLLLDLLVLIPLLHLYVPPCRVFDSCEVLTLLLFVVKTDLFFGDVAVEDAMPLVFLQQFVLLELELVDSHVDSWHCIFCLAIEGSGVID